MELIDSSLDLIMKHSLSACYFHAVHTMENAIMPQTWSLSLINLVSQWTRADMNFLLKEGRCFHKTMRQVSQESK